MHLVKVLAVVRTQGKLFDKNLLASQHRDQYVFLCRHRIMKVYPKKRDILLNSDRWVFYHSDMEWSEVGLSFMSKWHNDSISILIKH